MREWVDVEEARAGGGEVRLAVRWRRRSEASFLRPRRVRRAPHPACIARGDPADDRYGLSRDQLEEGDGFVPVAALGSDRWAVLGVFRILGRLRRDPGDECSEVDDALGIRGDREMSRMMRLSASYESE